MKQVILTGDRPTGRLHVGHYVGSLKERVELQNSGVMDRYMESARAICARRGVPVCDCYAQWKQLQAAGVNTTELLSNKLNHPTREMNWLFAVSLLRSILSGE